ncbi:cryptococcal mannosyltransferase 1-domain-containing protein [Cerioporus squamosus]|nr:cryptococcal mannosyltransferase 1-domain-containing protein [Cerioporus squamosus]
MEQEGYNLLGNAQSEDENVESDNEVAYGRRRPASTRKPGFAAISWYAPLLIYATIAFVGFYEWVYHEHEGDIRFGPALRNALTDPHPRPAGYARGEKIFIAAAFCQNEAVIPYWTRTMLDTILYLGTDNVFVSIVENYSKDRSPELLRDFAQELDRRGVRNRVLVQDETVQKPPKLEWNPRIEFLAAVRNQALEPLLESGGYDKVLFSNDIFIEPESVIELLETRNGDYDFACGFDFGHWGAYDMWVLRDRLGRLTAGIWPYFFDAAGYDAIKAEEPVPVFTCWNGIVAFQTDPLLPVHLRSNRTLSASPLPSPPPPTHPWALRVHDAGSPALTPPLAFRASAEGECFSSESFLLPYDFRRVMGLDRVYVNPRVITAYRWKWYVWHKWVLRQRYVKWFVERVWDGAWMQHARMVVGDPKESGSCSGFNSHVVGPVHAAVVVHWIELAARRRIPKMKLECATGTLFEHYHIMRYGPNILQKDTGFSRERQLDMRVVADDEQLRPGDYVCNLSESALNLHDIEGVPIAHDPLRRAPVAVWKGKQDRPGLIIAIPADLRAQKDTEDKKCLLTGSLADVEVGWIYPPAMWHHAGRSEELGIPRGRGPVFTTYANLVVMRKDLLELFDQNAFSIDVDDGFRIYRFLQSAVDAPDLPDKLEASEVDEAMIPFLRTHFHHTLSLRIFGGSIESFGSDYPWHQIQDFLAQMGLPPYDEDEFDSHVPYDDERWNTPIGQDAKKFYARLEHTVKNVKAPIYHSSEVARNRKADTFIWWPFSISGMIACFSVELTGPIRAATLAHWISIAGGRSRPNLKLACATGAEFSHRGIMWYTPVIFKQRPSPRSVGEESGSDVNEDGGSESSGAEESGERAEDPGEELAIPLVPDSEQIRPGDYVCWPGGSGEDIPRPPSISVLVPIAEIKRAQGPLLDCTIPAELRQRYDAIHGDKSCIFTGSLTGVEVGWIFPPTLSQFVPRAASEIGIPRDEQTYATPSNLVTMRKDIFELFDENAFGIDVDDGFKIYKFLQSAANAVDLPEKLEASAVDQAMIPSLRAHLHWTLCLNFLGGAIDKDYPIPEIREFRAEMGLEHDPDVELVPLDDKRWDSPMGRDAKKLFKLQGKEDEEEWRRLQRVYDADGNYLGLVHERDIM